MTIIKNKNIAEILNHVDKESKIRLLKMKIPNLLKY